LFVTHSFKDLQVKEDLGLLLPTVVFILVIINEPWTVRCFFYKGESELINFFLSEYQKLLKTEPSGGGNKNKTSSTLDEATIWLNIACCYFSMGMNTEANEAAVKGTACPLKNRLLFHLAHKLDNEDAVIANHSKLEEILENQLSLASMHYLRQDFQK
jgi:hypothetical protein